MHSIEICGAMQTSAYIPSLLGLDKIHGIEVLPCITIRWMLHLVTVSFAILVPRHLFRGLLCHVQPLQPL
jgi:hypothetical protein